MVVLGLRCFAWAFSSRSERAPLFSWGSWASHCGGSSCCRAQAVERGVSSCGVVPRHVESSQTRDWTHVPCTGRRAPNLWTTREVHFLHLFVLLRPSKEWMIPSQPGESGFSLLSSSDSNTCLFWKHTQTHPEIMLYWLSGHLFAQSSWCLTWTITKAEWEAWLEWRSKTMLEPVFEDVITLGHLVPAEWPRPLKYWTWFIWSEKRKQATGSCFLVSVKRNSLCGFRTVAVRLRVV